MYYERSGASYAFNNRFILTEADGWEDGGWWQRIDYGKR